MQDKNLLLTRLYSSRDICDNYSCYRAFCLTRNDSNQNINRELDGNTGIWY